MRAETREDPEASARARQRLLQRAADPAVGRARPRPSRRWVWPLAGVGGLAAAGLVVAVVLGGITPVARAANAPAGAVQPGAQNILLVAAERAEDAAPGAGRYMPVRPGVRAAAGRMLDDLSGARDLGSVQDAQGRAGQAVAVIDENRNGTFESRLIIDPDSGRPLARETRLVQPDGSSELTNHDLVVDTGYTDDSPPPVPVHWQAVTGGDRPMWQGRPPRGRARGRPRRCSL